MDFKIAPCLPRTLLLCHGLGGSSPRCAPCAAGEVLHSWPAPLQRCSRCGAGRQGGIHCLLLPHALPWLCTSPARGQTACGHPWALAGQGTLLPRHPPGRLLGSALAAWCPGAGGEEHPYFPALPPAARGPRDPFTPGQWSLGGDGSTPSASFPQGAGLWQEQREVATSGPPRECGKERSVSVRAGIGKAQASS